MKKEVINILRGLRAESTDVHMEVEDLRWAEAHGNIIDWASWHEALKIIEDRKAALQRDEIRAQRRNCARAHKIINNGVNKDAGIRVLTRACAAYRDEAHLGYTGWNNLEELKAALYAASTDAADRTTWPAWVESLMYDLTPEWSKHKDVGGAHAALRATVEALFPFDSNAVEQDEMGGLVSLHKGRSW